jgi:hypothetical protein
LQEDNSGSWEDIADMGFIEFVKGDKYKIDCIITDEVFNSIVPIMIKILNKI